MMRDMVYTAGTFDLFHAGHATFLRRASRIGDVTVAVNTDRFVKEYKGAAPVIPYQSRVAVLEACKWVSAVVPQDSADLRSQIEDEPFSYIAIGSDWARKDYYAQTGLTQDWIDERRIILCYIPYTEGISSSEIRQRLQRSSSATTTQKASAGSSATSSTSPGVQTSSWYLRPRPG